MTILLKSKIYYIFKKKKTYKHNNNNEKLRPESLGAGMIQNRIKRLPLGQRRRGRIRQVNLLKDKKKVTF